MYRYTVHGPRSKLSREVMVVRGAEVQEPQPAETAATAATAAAAAAGAAGAASAEVEGLLRHVTLAPGILKLAPNDVHAHCLCPDCVLQPLFFYVLVMDRKLKDSFILDREIC